MVTHHVRHVIERVDVSCSAEQTFPEDQNENEPNVWYKSVDCLEKKNNKINALKRKNKLNFAAY